MGAGAAVHQGFLCRVPRRHQRGVVRVHQIRRFGRHRPKRGRRFHRIRVAAIFRQEGRVGSLDRTQGLRALAFRLPAAGRRGQWRDSALCEVCAEPVLARAHVVVVPPPEGLESRPVFRHVQGRRGLPPRASRGLGRDGRGRRTDDPCIRGIRRRHGILLRGAGARQRHGQLGGRELHIDHVSQPRSLDLRPDAALAHLRFPVPSHLDRLRCWEMAGQRGRRRSRI
mmetsp:Transcript_25949/g.78134  ORF Transcript_25949/g.78134 Transcript_25949/m.78134 type:complete len:226 (-) Transcript_25949:18-695(-)